MMNRMIFAANINKLRRKKGLTQAETARQLGVGDKRYFQWEAGVCYPKITMLVKLADYFDYKDIYNLLTTPIE